MANINLYSAIKNVASELKDVHKIMGKSWICYGLQYILGFVI